MRKTYITLFTLAFLILIGLSIAFFIERKDIEKEEIEGIRIGMSINDARNRIPPLICENIGGLICSAIVNDSVVEVRLNLDEKIYAILSAVTINTMDLIQVKSAAKNNYKNADFIDDDARFYWYYNKKGDAYKSISISQNKSYHWFCSSFTTSLKPPNCKSDSIVIVKRLMDDRKKSIWFDKNSPELQKIK
jgi:hypothetical protein